MVHSQMGIMVCRVQILLSYLNSRQEMELFMLLSFDTSCKDEGKGCKSFLHGAHLLPMRHKPEISSQHCHAEEYTRHVLSSPDTFGICASTNQASTSNEFTQQASATNLASQNMLQFAKTRKISDERADPRKLVSISF